MMANFSDVKDGRTEYPLRSYSVNDSVVLPEMSSIVTRGKQNVQVTRETTTNTQ